MALPPGPFSGDGIIPDAAMVYDRTRVIKGPAAAVYPWVVQLGKGRGGWYLTSFWEKLFPTSWRAARHIGRQWQNLQVGDRVEDYGTSKDDYFDVMAMEKDKSLVYKSERYGTVFSWAILLHENDARSDDIQTIVHLRFRGRIQSTGWKRSLIVWGGNWIDHWTTAPMLAGLAERVEKPHLR